MKLVKSILFIVLLLVVGYGLYLYFSPKKPDSSLIAQLQTGSILETGSINTEQIDRTFILGSGQKIGRHGRKVGGEHFGLVDVVSGNILMSGNDIVGGQINVDLSTIQVNELTGTLHDQLLAHLKDSFFEVDKFPLATLQIVGVTGFTQDNTNLTGLAAQTSDSGMIVNLKMHGVTNQIIVPVIIDFSGKNLLIDSVFYIDRTQRGIIEAEGVVDKYFGISGKLQFYNYK